LYCKARPEQAVVNGDVADGDGARRGMPNVLTEAEILEKIAGVGFV
jgi:hypothetical protein